jgi:hypothetical protein
LKIVQGLEILAQVPAVEKTNDDGLASLVHFFNTNGALSALSARSCNQFVALTVKPSPDLPSLAALGVVVVETINPLRRRL